MRPVHRPVALILTAPVGGGHDAAARAVARELEDLGYATVVANALRRSGRWVEWVIVRGYRFQLRHAPWSYELMYRLLKRRLPSRFGKWLPGFIGARSIRKLCDEVQPSVIVTTYHLAGAMLSRLRRQGRLRVPAAAVITDLAPHPMWCYPRLDAHLTMDERSADAFAPLTKAPTFAVRPPVDPAFGRSDRAVARDALGLTPDDRAVAVVGGAWGTGHADDTARACADAGWRPVVVTGHNDELRASLEASAPDGTIVLGYTDDMPAVVAACDAVIVNAPGLTCLEAFASRVPVLIHEPIPGHGRDNAAYMDACGLLTYARSAAELTSALEAMRDDPRPLQVARAARMFDGPRCADVLTALRPAPAPRRRRAAVAVLVACLIPALTTTRVGVAETSNLLRRPLVQPGGQAQDVALCIRFGRDLAHEHETLSLLRSDDANATFFVSFEDASEHPSIVRTLISGGNEIGNGGDGETLLIPMAVRKYRRANEGLRVITGVSPRYSMPVGGRLTLGQVLAASHVRPVLGAIGASDRAMRTIRRGEIFVIDLSRPDGVQRVRQLLRAAAERDLRVVDVSQLLAARTASHA